MTREVINELKKYASGRKNTEKVEISVLQINRIIKALEQEPVLDKIRAEIKHLTYYYYWSKVNPRIVIDDVFKIIDKYKADRSMKE